MAQGKIETLYNKYELKEGNIIKLGNFYLKLKRLKIKENKEENSKFINPKFHHLHNSIETINLNSNNNNSLKNNNKTNLKLIFNDLEKNVLNDKAEKVELNLARNDKSIILNKTEKEKTCRICYSGDAEEDNPLIHPCSCIGSMKYIHYKCLKYWLEKNYYKLEYKLGLIRRYRYKEPECELCKSKFPEIIYYKGKEYSFLDTNGEFNDYAIFEKIPNDDNNHKILYIFSLDKKNQILKFGRALDNHFIIQDNSISRNHCGLLVLNNKFFIEDMNSKFGTLLFIQSQTIQLGENQNLYLQVGNNFIIGKVYNPSLNSFFSCCGVDNQDKRFDYYYRQNIINPGEDNKNNNNLHINSKASSDNESDEEKIKEKENKIKISEFVYINKIKNERPKKSKTNNIATNANMLPENGIKIIPENENEN